MLLAGVCGGVGLLAGFHIQVEPLAGLHNHFWLSRVIDYVLWQDTAAD